VPLPDGTQAELDDLPPAIPLKKRTMMLISITTSVSWGKLGADPREMHQNAGRITRKIVGNELGRQAEEILDNP